MDITQDVRVLAFLQDGMIDNEWTITERKRVRQRASRYFMNGNILFQKPTGRFSARMVPAVTERKEHVVRLHALGRYGINRTLSMVQSQYYWAGMTHDVKKKILNCQVCEFRRVHWNRDTELHPIPIERPWSRVVIDLLGPLPKTDRGSTYIVSAIDHFTKWAEAAPI